MLFLPWKVISIAHFECVYVALVIHRSERMRRILWPLVPQHFLTLSRKWHVFRKKVFE